MVGRPRKTPEGGRTTARGYDGEHRKARARALAELEPGTPCPFCREPMFAAQQLDYDHLVPVAEGGKDGPRRLAHASCNRSAGGRLGAAVTNGRARGSAGEVPPPAPGTSCYDCGMPMTAGQQLRRVPRVGAIGGAWSHARCEIRGVYVPPALL